MAGVMYTTDDFPRTSVSIQIAPCLVCTRAKYQVSYPGSLLARVKKRYAWGQEIFILHQKCKGLH